MPYNVKATEYLCILLFTAICILAGIPRFEDNNQDLKFLHDIHSVWLYTEKIQFLLSSKISYVNLILLRFHFWVFIKKKKKESRISKGYLYTHIHRIIHK